MNSKAYVCFTMSLSYTASSRLVNEQEDMYLAK